MQMVINMTIYEQERLYEYGLPGYLQNDLDAFKDGLGNGSTLMDCLWGELYGSINIAEINEGGYHARTRRLSAEEIPLGIN